MEFSKSGGEGVRRSSLSLSAHSTDTHTQTHAHMREDGRGIRRFVRATHSTRGDKTEGEGERESRACRLQMRKGAERSGAGAKASGKPVTRGVPPRPLLSSVFSLPTSSHSLLSLSLSFGLFSKKEQLSSRPQRWQGQLSGSTSVAWRLRYSSFCFSPPFFFSF